MTFSLPPITGARDAADLMAAVTKAVATGHVTPGEATDIAKVIDTFLNDGSGIELRHGLNATGVSVPVIYITGNDTPAVREAAHQSGCLAYLTKPFSAKALMEPLHRAAA